MDNTIWFPKLGNLHFTIDGVAFSVFGLNVYWYGVIIATGFLLAVILGMRSSKKFGIDPDSIVDLILIAAPISIITSRLYYVIFSLGEPGNPYINNPVEIFKIWNGGLAIYGAVIGALGTAYIFARVRKISALNLFDFGTPYLILAQAIGRWGNFVNQEAFGTNTDLPWGMTSEKIKNYLSGIKASNPGINPDLPVHPTFLYESLWNFGIFFFLIWYRKKKKKIDGEVFFLYMILYGAGRFFIEGIRTDSLMLGALRISQLLALLFVVAFLIAFYIRRRHATRLAEEGAACEPSRYREVLEKLKEESVTEESGSASEENEDNDESRTGERPDDDMVPEDNGGSGDGENGAVKDEELSNR